MSQSLLLECKQTKRLTNLPQEDFRLAGNPASQLHTNSFLNKKQNINSLIKI